MDVYTSRFSLRLSFGRFFASMHFDMIVLGQWWLIDEIFQKRMILLSLIGMTKNNVVVVVNLFPKYLLLCFLSMISKTIERFENYAVYFSSSPSPSIAFSTFSAHTQKNSFFFNNLDDHEFSIDAFMFSNCSSHFILIRSVTIDTCLPSLTASIDMTMTD